MASNLYSPHVDHFQPAALPPTITGEAAGERRADPAPALSAALSVDLLPVGSTPGLASAWQDLERRADGSFFLSWLWVGTWLRHVPEAAQPHVLTVRRGDAVVGLAILCRRSRRRLGLVRTRRLMLHETGDREFDRLSVEYNGILADRCCAEAVTLAGLAALGRLDPAWDELVLGGLDPIAEAAVRQSAVQIGYTVHLRHQDGTHWVDLDRARTRGGFRCGLGRNTRAAVNRAVRLYEARGPLEYRTAEDAREALAFFDAMEVLHRAAWAARGKRSAFDNAAFGPFHRDLIARAGASGNVRMVRVSAGGGPFAVLYNVVWRGRVLNYQSGFAYEPDNRLKPGLVSHTLAIEDALARGERAYDFLAYPAGHKTLLADATTPMSWIAIGPDRVGRRIDAALDRAERRVRAVCGTVRRCWRRVDGRGRV